MFRKAFALLVLAALPLAAQFPRPRSTYAGPDYWVGLSYGFVDGTTIHDGDTGDEWRFGYTSQIRATLEKTIQRNVTAGISAAYATAPLTYVNSAGLASCGFSCDAKADVTQYMAFIHGGGGLGFHGVYSLEGGVTQFSNFRDRDTDDRLPPANGKYDFSFGLGGGIGYGFSPTSDIYVAEMFDFVLHPQGSAASTSAPRITTFRAGIRIGF
jgi:hypothetical protein